MSVYKYHLKARKGVQKTYKRAVRALVPLLIAGVALAVLGAGLLGSSGVL